MKQYTIIVDPLSSGALYAEQLRQHELIPVAVLSHFPILSLYEKSFQKNDFEHVFIVTDESQLINEITDFFNDKNLAFILAGAECGVELADQLSSHFCPSTSNGVALSAARRNKFLMMQTLYQHRILSPMTIQTSSINEALNFCRHNALLPGGVVIKPINSAGTDSVSVCCDEAAVISAMIKHIGTKNVFNITNEKMLVQEFLSGTEYVVDTASVHGIHTVTNICRYQKIQANDSAFVYDSVDFLDPRGEIQTILSEYIFAVLTALHIQFGPAHAEVMMTNHGPRLIEIGARVHGGVGVMASRLATGSSHLDETLHLLLCKRRISTHTIEFTLQQATKIVFLISRESGVIQSEKHALNTICTLLSVQFSKLLVKPGDQLKKTTDLFSTPGILILSHEDAYQVEQDYMMIRTLEAEGLFRVIA